MQGSWRAAACFAALSRREVDQLFLVVDDLRKRGVAMMFVGHRMEEIYEVSDRVVVLRDGKVIAGAPIDEMPRDRAIQLMVGRALADLYPKRSNTLGEVVIAVEGLSRGTMFENVSFTVRSGVGAAMIAGVGAGVFKGYEDARKLAPVFTVVTEPNLDDAALYESHYRRFVNAYPRLRGWF